MGTARKRVVIGDRIRQIMGGRSFDELSRDIEAKTGVRIDRTTIQKWANGTRHPNSVHLDALARYAGRPKGWFLLSDEEIDELCAQSAASMRATLDKEIDRLLDELPLLTFSSRRQALSDRDKLLILALARLLGKD